MFAESQLNFSAPDILNLAPVLISQLLTLGSIHFKNFHPPEAHGFRRFFDKKAYHRSFTSNTDMENKGSPLDCTVAT
jgi:hypothetical protein